MRATKPARFFVAIINTVGRYWGLLAVAVVAVLEALVFAPRQQVDAMIWGGIVGTALLIGWLLGV